MYAAQNNYNQCGVKLIFHINNNKIIKTLSRAPVLADRSGSAVSSAVANYCGSDSPERENTERHPQGTTVPLPFFWRKYLVPISLIELIVLPIKENSSLLNQTIDLTLLTGRRGTVKR